MSAVTSNRLNTNPHALPVPVYLPGYRIDPGTLAQYLELIDTSITQERSCIILYHNLHTLYAYFKSEDLRRYYRDCTVLVDGMPLIALLRMAGIKAGREHRVTYVDFILPMMQRARDAGWRVFHVGQSAAVQDTALGRLTEKVPGLQIEGHPGYFDMLSDSPENQAVIDRINASGPQLLLIGFGTPLQERWIAENRHRLSAPVILACGACMEYVAGAVPVPPRWMGRLGLEWAARLLSDPRRFAFRYLVEPLMLAGFLAKHWVVAKARHPAADHGDGHR